MQADQTVYLHPGRARLPHDAMVVGEHHYPDVVLEVDHTTDVRRGKLGLYEEWGFPELWVEVPEHYTASRPRGLFPGLRIYLPEGGGYRLGRASRAFPGWMAEEIHLALNEEAESEATGEALRRVGRVLGEREGAVPGDTPWLRLERRESRAEGHAEGYAEGRAEFMAAVMETIPESRGMALFQLDERDLTGVTDREVMDALLQCEDESDFRARLERLRRAAVF